MMGEILVLVLEHFVKTVTEWIRNASEDSEENESFAKEKQSLELRLEAKTKRIIELESLCAEAAYELKEMRELSDEALGQLREMSGQLEDIRLVAGHKDWMDIYLSLQAARLMND